MATIKSHNKRLNNLKTDQSGFRPLWMELSDYHLSHRGRFLTSDRNKGHKRNTKQPNNTSRLSLRTLASGMMAGITSPARPWFRLGTPDPKLKDHPEVMQWLHEVEVIIYATFSKSNIYNALHTTYTELGCFGTAALGVYEDFENVIRGKPYTVGSYYLAQNGKDEIDTFYREYEITVSQCVKMFGYDECSNHVKTQWDKGNTETWVKVVHAIEPNDNRDHQSPLASDMAYRSVYYEIGAQSTRDDSFLRKSGFDGFPILAPRWDITGEDVYATDCPGITALGDTKALQLGERKMYQALDKIIDPPLQGPSSLRNKTGDSLRSGQILWLGATTEGLSSIYGNYKPDLAAIEVINNKVEGRIQRAFYEDLFLMLANSDRRQITAREVAEKHEEKLLMLGPVLERLHNELLDPLIQRTFDLLMKGEVLPPPPEVLQGTELRVEYVSVLAQAQQLVNVGSIERVVGFAADLMAAGWAEAGHKIKIGDTIDAYNEAVGNDPAIIRSNDEVEGLVRADQEAAQAQAEAEAESQQVDNAKKMSETSTADGNALTEMMREQGLA